MTVPDFLDSNVLLYAYDSTAREKQPIAEELLRRAVIGHVITSTQALAEFSAVLLHKATPPTPPAKLVSILDSLAPIRVIHPDQDIVRRAVEAHAQYGIHFYDGMIVAAAERGGCSRIWSEDLNSGQKYFGIVVQNPFRDQV
jgi:predicted nucleic acid-binding protein